MSESDLSLLAIGLVTLGLGLYSRSLRHTLLTEPLIALVTGLLLGPTVLDLLHPERWPYWELLLEEAARLTLAIGLMALVLRLPAGETWRRRRSLALLLMLVMPFMAGASALLGHWLLGLPLWTALLVGATICPTDPVVSSSLLTGEVAERGLPERVRNVLSLESGANDGLAYPLVFLPILMLRLPAGEAFQEWLLRSWLWEVGVGGLVGYALGWGAGRLLVHAERVRSIESYSFLAYTLALTLLTLGLAGVIEADGIFAVFTAGLAFDGAVGKHERAEEERVQEAINRFFTLPFFILLGAAAPWGEWSALGWRGVAVVAGVLLLRRLPVLLPLSRILPDLRSLRDVAFVGWFGPIGIAAIYYALVVRRETGLDEPWVIGSLVVCASVLVHGVTTTPLIRLYRARTFS